MKTSLRPATVTSRVPVRMNQTWTRVMSSHLILRLLWMFIVVCQCQLKLLLSKHICYLYQLNDHEVTKAFGMFLVPSCRIGQTHCEWMWFSNSFVLRWVRWIVRTTTISAGECSYYSYMSTFPTEEILFSIQGYLYLKWTGRWRPAGGWKLTQWWTGIFFLIRAPAKINHMSVY